MVKTGIASLVSVFNKDILSGEYTPPTVIKSSPEVKVIFGKIGKRSFRRKILACLKRTMPTGDDVSSEVIKKAWCSVLIQALAPHISVPPPTIYEWSLVNSWVRKKPMVKVNMAA